MTTSGSPNGWVPSACTLPTAQQPLRIAEFDTFFRDVVRDVQRRGPTRLDLTIDADAEALARDLTDRETACCSFFQFTFTGQADGRIVMTLTVPGQHADVLAALAERVTSTATAGDRRG